MSARKKLNVCLMNDSFPPVIDGVSNATFNYAQILSARGCGVTVATPEYPKAHDDYPFQVLRYPSFDTTKMVGYRAGMPLGLDFLTQFKRMDIDLIHSHCPFSSTILARTVRDIVHKPVIMTYHTKFDIDIKRAVDNKMLQDVAIKYLVSNIAAVDEVWVVSRGAGENLRSLGYRGDYVVMENGVDISRQRASAKDVAAFSRRYHLRSNVPTYLFVGRIMWYKGLRIIIDALRAIRGAGLDFQMIFVGGGMALNEVKDYAMKSKIDDRCVFTGPIYDREQLRTVYTRADAFLFPSTFDTNGIVVREAAACGCPSVLIKGSCAAEDTKDGRNAILIDEDAASLAARLAVIGDDTALLRKIGEHAATDLYMSWEQSVDRAYRRYQTVLADYHYRKRKALMPSMDDFYKVWAMLAKGMAGVKDINEITQMRRQETKELIDSYLDRYL